MIQTDQVTIPDLDLYQNPTDLAEEMLKRISNLPPERIERSQFIVEVQGNGVFHDLKNHTSELKSSVIRVTVIPFITEA
jgi:hypothetical protein